MFAIIHITNPAGMATETALPSTNKVLSNMDLTIILPIWGFRYGGSSRAKEEGSPFNIVWTEVLKQATSSQYPKGLLRSKRALKAPIEKNLQNFHKEHGYYCNQSWETTVAGYKLLVIVAISLSRGESIIRHPMTPAALQPKPMHMVRDCLP